MRWNKTEAKATGLLLLMLLCSLLLGQNSSEVQPQAPLHPAPPSPPLIMIDAAHGGSETGALLSPAIPEKDVTLMFARRLRQELGARGISASVIRDNDATLTTDQRAAVVNSARPALYICIHASSLGSGMAVFTVMLPSGGDNRGPFNNWRIAQTTAAARSSWVQQQVVAAMQKTGFPVRSLLAPLQPLNNVSVPALAIEVAPTDGNVSQLASADYQQMVSAALSNAIAGLGAVLRSTDFHPAHSVAIAAP